MCFDNISTCKIMSVITISMEIVFKLNCKQNYLGMSRSKGLWSLKLSQLRWMTKFLVFWILTVEQLMGSYLATKTKLKSNVRYNLFIALIFITLNIFILHGFFLLKTHFILFSLFIVKLYLLVRDDENKRGT